jgi:DNA-binding transcriptional LysR family regulator
VPTALVRYHDRMTAAVLPHLETFVEAAERGSFTAAARALRVTQAAVSQRIHQLEAAVKVTLFHRDGGHMKLTDAGRLLHSVAQRILALHAEARAGLKGVKPIATGELVIAASTVPGDHLLPPILAAFRRKFPLIKIVVRVSDTDSVLRAVRRGQAHLGAVGARPDDPGLEYRPFAREELVLVVAADHAWRRRRAVSFEHLRGQPLIQREAGSGSRQCFEEALRAAGHSASDLAVSMELGSNEAIKEAVAQGAGVAVLSSRVVQKEVGQGTLHQLKLKGLTLDREFYFVRDGKRALPATAQLFLIHAGAEA